MLKRRKMHFPKHQKLPKYQEKNIRRKKTDVVIKKYESIKEAKLYMTNKKKYPKEENRRRDKEI